MKSKLTKEEKAKLSQNVDKEIEFLEKNTKQEKSRNPNPAIAFVENIEIELLQKIAW